MASKKRKKKTSNGITFGMMMVIVISMVIVLLLTSVKIYLANQIYYESKKVNKLLREVSALKSERVMLKNSVEALRFKANVTGTIFTIQESNND